MLSSVDVVAGDYRILDGVTLKLHPGELCGLIGPSGAGKSTLIKVLLGLRDPKSGDATLGGGPVTAVPIGYVPQDDALHRTLTVEQALSFAAELRLPDLAPEHRAARIREVTQQVQLDERMDVRVKKLSGGQRKRVSVALELLTEPPILILDEPTSGLDPGLEATMMELFEGLAKSGRIVLVATHAMQSLLRCQALCVLVKGKVAYFGRPEDAPAHFGVGTFAGIFEVLATKDPAEWGKAWNASAMRPSFLGRGAPAIGGPTRKALPDVVEAGGSPKEEPAPLSAAEQLAAMKAARGKE